VLDLVDGPAAYGPALLAGLGADVVRVEPPAGSARRTRPPRYHALDGDDNGDGAGPSLHLLHYDRGKRGITLDRESEMGRDLLRRLIERADVVLDNGDLARLGFDLPALVATRPLVVASVTPFGLSGPRSAWLGPDLVVQALSGMVGYFGYRGERPARFAPEQASEMSGLALALGTLIALFGARRSGRGELVDIAMERVCALVTLQMWNASIYHQFGFIRQRPERANGTRGTLYQTADGWVALGAYRRVPELLAMLTAAGAAEDLPALWERMTPEQFQADPHVEEVVARFIAARTSADVIERAQAHGMLGLPVHDVADLVADPFLHERAFFVEVECPELGLRFADTGAPVRLSGTSYRPGRRPPRLGEHNAALYGELGLDAAALDRLRAEGVV
jgi:benzylsuccinate CoA-transferase BbsE subunit